MSSLKLTAVSTYPPKSVPIDVASDATIGDIKTAVKDALKLDITGYGWLAASFGEDAIVLSQKADKDKVTLKPGTTIFATCPIGQLPVRERKQVEDLKDDDKRFAGLTVENIFQKIAKANGKAKTNAFEYLDMNASEVLKSKAFLNLPLATVKAVIGRDTLDIEEVEVFDAVINWGTKHVKSEGKSPSNENVKKFVEELIPFIRFPFFTTEQFASKAATSGFLSPEQTLALFTYLAQKDMIGEKAVVPTGLNGKPRKNAGGKELKCDVSKNEWEPGLFHFLGCQASSDKKTWTNPHIAGHAIVTGGTPSSPTSCSADYAQRLVSNTEKQVIQIIGNDAFFSINITPSGFQFLPKAFWIRHRGEHVTDYVSNFNMEASNDGVSWTNWSVQNSDHKLNRGLDCSAKWTATVKETKFYTHFRIHMTGPSGAGLNYLSLQNVELYGIVKSNKK